MLLILSILSMIVGNLVAIAQTNIKRMLAYSTIANMGFLLLGFVAATPNGYSAAMFYAVAYVLTSLASFGVVILLSREGFEADRIDDFRGLNQRSPWWAFVMLLTMFSLAGVPPTVGFYAKFSVIQAVVQEGHVWVAVVAVMASLVGAFYYLRIVKLMYFDDPVDDSPIEPRGDTRVLLSANGLAAAPARRPAAAADGAVRRGARLIRLPLIRASRPDARSGGASGGRTRGARRTGPGGAGQRRATIFGFPGDHHARRLFRHLPRRPDAAVDRLRRDQAARGRRRRGLRAADADLLRAARVQLGRPRRHQGAGGEADRGIRGLRLRRRAVGLVQRHDPHPLRRALRRRSGDEGPRRRAGGEDLGAHRASWPTC